MFVLNVNLCTVCQRRAVDKCVGCTRYFCLEHFQGHRKELRVQLDKLEMDYYAARNSGVDRSRYKLEQLYTSFDQKLVESLESVMADQYSIDEAQMEKNKIMNKLHYRRDAFTVEMEASRKNFERELDSCRQRGDFTEVDLEQLREKLNRYDEKSMHANQDHMSKFREELEDLRHKIVRNCTFGAPFVDLNDANGYREYHGINMLQSGEELFVACVSRVSVQTKRVKHLVRE